MLAIAKSVEQPSLITDEYRAQCAQLHATTPWGVFGRVMAPMVQQVKDNWKCETLLDYGCGKRTLEHALGYPIANYDPGIPGLDAPPEPAELVTCTDVLEHIEPDLLDNVLDDIKRLSTKAVFLTISTRAAERSLPDGRNAHLIIADHTWWLPKLWTRWHLCSVSVDWKAARIIFIGNAKA